MPRKQRRQGRRDFGSIRSEGTPTEPAFSVRWWEGGKQRRKRGFRTRTEAEAFLARIRVALADGVLDAHRKAEVALSAVGDEWLRQHSAVKLRSHAHNVERWAYLIDFFGRSLAVGELTPTRIMQFRERLHCDLGRKPGTVNRYLALLRSVLNHAVAAGYLQVSPVRRFPRGAYLLSEGQGRLRPPLADADQAAQLLAQIRATAPEWYPTAAFLLFTGCRRGEAAGLHWEDVDLGRRMATIRRSHDTAPKSGKARTVPLSGSLVDILREHRERRVDGPHVFRDPATGRPLSRNGWALNDILDEACIAIGIERMRLHDLRHAHASLWLMAGGSIADVQRNLGHSTPVLTVNTYGHLGDDHRIAEADRRLNLGLPGARLSMVRNA